MGEVERGIWWRTLRKRDQLEYLGIYENNIKNGSLKKWDLEAWTGFIWLRIGAGAQWF